MVVLYTGHVIIITLGVLMFFFSEGKKETDEKNIVLDKLWEVTCVCN
jgi:hypothetical protein